MHHSESLRVIEIGRHEVSEPDWENVRMGSGDTTVSRLPTREELAVDKLRKICLDVCNLDSSFRIISYLVGKNVLRSFRLLPKAINCSLPNWGSHALCGNLVLTALPTAMGFPMNLKSLVNTPMKKVGINFSRFSMTRNRCGEYNIYFLVQHINTVFYFSYFAAENKMYYLIQIWYHCHQIFLYYNSSLGLMKRTDGKSGLRNAMGQSHIAFCKPVDLSGTTYEVVYFVDSRLGRREIFKAMGQCI